MAGELALDAFGIVVCNECHFAFDKGIQMKKVQTWTAESLNTTLW
jgi:hypothetical protein